MKLTNAEKPSSFISTVFAVLFAGCMEPVTCKSAVSIDVNMPAMLLTTIYSVFSAY